MITSKELMKVAESRGEKLTYPKLKQAMADCKVFFKTKVHHGQPHECYLTALDVRVLQEHTGIKFNACFPKR